MIRVFSAGRRLLFVALLIASATHVQAQNANKYPSKPIRVVIAFTAGGTPDTLARLLGPKIAESLGQPLILENRPGAGGAIAAAIVAKAAPDGYTLLATSGALAISAALSPKLPYDAHKDFSGVANIGYSTTAIIVSPALGVKSIKELIALANSMPGKFYFGSAGAGSGTYMNGERFRIVANIKAVHVAFKGQPEMIIEVVANRVHYASAGVGASMSLIKEGRLLPLAVMPARTPLLPDVPALPEILPGAARDGFQLWLAPAGVPLANRTLLSNEMAKALARPDIKDRLTAYGFQVHHSPPEETERLLRVDIATFTKLAIDAGLRSR